MRTVDCGGCRGEGAHKRWCVEHVGRSAAFFGLLSQQADDLADQVGSNEPGAANHLYQAGALLKHRALAERLLHEKALHEN